MNIDKTEYELHHTKCEDFPVFATKISLGVNNTIDLVTSCIFYEKICF